MDTTDSQAGPLPLLEALVRWSEPRLVEAVRVQERRHTPHEMAQLTYLPRLCEEAELAKPPASGLMGGQTSSTPLRAAWEALERDFRARLVRGDFHLLGVQMYPHRSVEHVPIPGVWAADMKFDFCANSVRVGGPRYVAVKVVFGPAPAGGQVATAGRVGSPPITPKTVRDLSDEEVLLLLEEHARRVVEIAEYRALDPGITKVSFMPIILRQMRARAAAGKLLPTWTAEAAELAKWIQQKAPSHQVPTAGAIENSLREEYWRLQA
jgi:hypothetical protein